jgi:hypothetical protein
MLESMPEQGAGSLLSHRLCLIFPDRRWYMVLLADGRAIQVYGTAMAPDFISARAAKQMRHRILKINPPPFPCLKSRSNNRFEFFFLRHQ